MCAKNAGIRLKIWCSFEDEVSLKRSTQPHFTTRQTRESIPLETGPRDITTSLRPVSCFREHRWSICQKKKKIVRLSGTDQNVHGLNHTPHRRFVVDSQSARNNFLNRWPRRMISALYTVPIIAYQFLQIDLLIHRRYYHNDVPDYQVLLTFAWPNAHKLPQRCRLSFG